MPMNETKKINRVQRWLHLDFTEEKKGGKRKEEEKIIKIYSLWFDFSKSNRV